jgi:hypothetical protein
MEFGGDSSETVSFLSQVQPMLVIVLYLTLLLLSLPEFTDAHVLDNLDSVLITENKLSRYFFDRSHPVVSCKSSGILSVHKHNNIDKTTRFTINYMVTCFSYMIAIYRPM